MSEKRPRISAETIDRLSHIVGTSDFVDVDDPESVSVERQVEALAEAYVRSLHDRRELVTRIRALEHQAEQRKSQKQSTSLFSSSSSSPGRSPGGGRGW